MTTSFSWSEDHRRYSLPTRGNRSINDDYI